MDKTTRFAALAALTFSLIALFRPSLLPGALAAGHGKDAWQTERQFPPLVFSSTAWLDCSISSKRNGRQIMKTLSGQGFNFDAAMLPIQGGLVKLKNPGMLYKFNAFPTTSVPATFTGLGAGSITEMKAEVEVDVRHYLQPGGPGTEIRFQAADISPNSAYVEFTGVFVRKTDSKRFPFRVVFGSVPSGGGKVLPGSSAPQAPLASKSVTLGSRQAGATVTTALYEAEDDVRTLK